MIEFSVLMRDTASAPPSFAAFAGARMFVTFGVSLITTGTRATDLHHSVACWMYSGTCPTADPMPRSDMPCGQPKLSSSASAPVSSIIGTYFAQTSRFIGSMIERSRPDIGPVALIWRTVEVDAQRPVRSARCC
jgi:hypothetical protein